MVVLIFVRTYFSLPHEQCLRPKAAFQEHVVTVMAKSFVIDKKHMGRVFVLYDLSGVLLSLDFLVELILYSYTCVLNKIDSTHHFLVFQF